MDSLVQKDQPCDGPELLRPACDCELVPLSEAQCQAQPVAAHVESLLPDPSARTRRWCGLAVTHAARSEISLPLSCARLNGWRAHTTISARQVWEACGIHRPGSGKETKEPIGPPEPCRNQE